MFDFDKNIKQKQKSGSTYYQAKKETIKAAFEAGYSVKEIAEYFDMPERAVTYHATGEIIKE